MSLKIIGYRDIPELIKKIALSPRMLLILPTQKKAHFIKNELLRYWESPGVFSLPELLFEQYKSRGGIKKRITPAQEILIMERIIEETWDDLHFFSQSEQFPGLAVKIKSLFNTLVQEKKTIHEVNEFAAQKEDLLILREKYLSFLREKELIDADCLLEMGGELVKDLNKDWESLGLDTLHYMMPVDWEIIGELEIGFARKFIFTDLLEKLPSGKTFLACLKEFHQDNFKLTSGKKQDCGSVGIFFNPEEETKHVARDLRRKVESGVPPANLFVVPAALEEYQALIMEIFPQYDIPFDISRGLPLEGSPPAILLKTILELVENPFSRQLLYRFFSSSLVELRGLDIEVIDDFARRFNYNDLEPLFKGEVDLGAILAKKDATSIGNQLKILGRFIENFLIPIQQNRDYRNIFSLLREIFLKISFLENVIDPGVSEGNFNPQEITIAIRKIYEVLDDAEQLFAGGVVFADNLQERIKHVLGRLIAEKEYYIPSRAGGVQVTGILNMRGWPAEKVYFMGVTADNFPGIPENNFLLPGKDSGQVLREARLFFYQIVSACGEVDISFPAYFKGKETRPSTLLKDFEVENFSGIQPGGDFAGLNDMLGFLAQYQDRETWQKFASPGDIKDIIMDWARENNLASKFNGFLGPGIGLTPDPVAVTALEDYWRCPFYYFLNWVLELRKAEEVEEEEELALFGLQIHRVLELFGKNNGFELLKQDLKAASDKMREIALEVLEEENIDLDRNMFVGAQYKNWLRGLGDGKLPEGVLSRFLREEQTRLEKFSPRDFETDLGKNNYFPKLGPFRLKGRVDRLDGFAEQDIMIYDYKTGRVPPGKEIREWRNLQLPLYVLALKNRPDLEGREILGGYYQLRHREPPALKPLIGDNLGKNFNKRSIIELEELGGREKYEEILGKIKEGIDRGNFQPTTWDREDAKCDYCSFRTVCRKNNYYRDGGNSRD